MHEHAPLGQREFLEHGLHRIQVILSRQIEHRVVLIVEAPVRFRGFAVADHEVVEIIPVGIHVTVRVHRHEAQMLEKPGVHAAHVAGIFRRHALDDVAFEP